MDPMENPPRRLAPPARADRPQYQRPASNKPGPYKPALKSSGPNKPMAYRPASPPAKPGRPAGSLPTGTRKQGSGVTDWNGVANWYDDLVGDGGSEFHREVVIPGTLRLLAAAKGDRVLDVACGQGVLCRALAAAGVEATGVDAAIDLIRAARDRQAGVPADVPPVTYQVGDARDLSFLKSDSFAAAACVLAVQNIHPLGGLLGGIARCLRPGGRAVLVMNHPAFRIPKSTGWGWDAGANVQYRRVDHYLQPRKIPIVTHPGSEPDKYTWTFHKPIGAYVKALRHAGLLVDAIEEWPSHKRSDSGPRAGAENTAREEIPMFMAIRAVRVGDGAATPAVNDE